MFGTLLITSFATIIVIFFVIQKRKQLQHVMRQQQLKFDFEHSLLSTRIEVQEQVLANMSLDIHDNIGQTLSLGCMQLANLKESIEAPATLKKLDDTLQLFKQTVKDLRLLSHNLNTGLIEERALEHSIQTELSRIEAFSNLKCTLEMANEEAGLPASQKLIVFRIFQEALQNILKHAQATEINVLFQRDAERIFLKIEDNGIGFEPGKDQHGDSLGMLGMRQRAAFLGATLTIQSWPGKGTALTLAAPVNVSL